MKKMIFFILLLAFSRVGVALGMGTTPIGIGNFFLGSPSITQSNLNQVLGLLVGPAGAPGVAGISGSNGKDGINGLAGIPGVNGVNGVDGSPSTPGVAGAQGVAGPAGRDGAPGAQGSQGVAGPAGPAGPAGSGGGLIGVGGGNVSLGTCDDTVNIAATQSFEGDHFNLATVTVSGILGIVGTNNGCAGQDVTIHVKALTVSKECTLTLPNDITGTANRITFMTSSCGGVLAGIKMQDLDSNIGLEFTEHRVS
jgi:hypothetical protein